MEQSRKGFYGAIPDGSIGELGSAGVYREFQAKMQFAADEGDDADVHDDSETEQLLQSSPSSNGGSLERSRSAFCDNKVTTSKYTLVSFIPRCGNPVTAYRFYLSINRNISYLFAGRFWSSFVVWRTCIS